MNIAGMKVQVLLSSRDTRGRYAICRVEVDRQGQFSEDVFGSPAIPIHSHRYEDAFFHILDGEFEFQLGNSVAGVQTVQGVPGASIFVPRQTPYTMRKLGSTPGSLLIIAQPGGVDLFLQDLNLLFHDSRPAADTNRLTAILEKHGITISDQHP